MEARLSALVLASGLACAPKPVEQFEGELAFGRLDADQSFTPYAVDPASGRELVEVELGFQGAWMVAMVAELPPEHVGHRVDFGCSIETATWASGRERLEDVLVDDVILHAPFMILSWWVEEPTQAEVRCEVRGPTRVDVTSVDAILIPAGSGEVAP